MQDKSEIRSDQSRRTRRSLPSPDGEPTPSVVPLPPQPIPGPLPRAWPAHELVRETRRKEEEERESNETKKRSSRLGSMGGRTYPRSTTRPTTRTPQARAGKTRRTTLSTSLARSLAREDTSLALMRKKRCFRPIIYQPHVWYPRVTTLGRQTQPPLPPFRGTAALPAATTAVRMHASNASRSDRHLRVLCVRGMSRNEGESVIRQQGG